MGGSSSYLKLKVNEHVACFIYSYNGNYIQRTISCHPDNRFNVPKNRDYNYYYYYSGNDYYFDGDIENLNKLLGDFDPNKTNVRYLVNRLESECDLQQYKGLWEKVTEWADYVIKLPKNALNIMYNGTKYLLSYYCEKEEN